MKKIISVGLAAVMLLTLLTGCMAEVGEITINEDGSGTAKVMVGYTEEAINGYLDAEGGYAGVTEQMEQFQTFEYNGVTYYGEIVEDTFDSIYEIGDTDTEISEIFNDGPSGIQILPVDGEYGKFRVILATDTTADVDTEITESFMGSGEEIGEKELEQLISTMVIVLKITLPSDVRQLTGDAMGVTVDGKTITLDIMEMSKAEGQYHVYQFTNSETAQALDIEIQKETSRFSDVSTDAWYYDAVEYMAKQGLVNGVGDGKFNPNGKITYAQFSQIVANAAKLKTGAQNNYWAYSAVESCLQYNIVGNRGPITSANYDVPMSRDAAVAGMYRLLANFYPEEYSAEVRDINAIDIPDYDQIGTAYKDDVVRAYKIGITDGVDSNRTFSPASILTRAQVCQLMYNMLAK